MSIFILLNSCTVSFLLEKSSKLKEIGHEGRIHHFFLVLLLFFCFVFLFFYKNSEKAGGNFSLSMAC